MISVLGEPRSRANEARLVVFLLLSILLHAAVMGALPSLTGPSPETTLKKPIWVDLLDVDEPESPEPASMAPAMQHTTLPPEQVVARKPAPPKENRLGKQPAKEQDLTPASPAPMPDEAKAIPPVKDLIPSMQNLLAMQEEGLNDPFRALHMGPRQDGAGQLPAETLFEQYLLELKRKVERNWRVSVDLGIREGVTVIYVIVAGDGSLFSCDIVKPSGMIAHDYEAREAVVQAFPLSPPPKTLLNDKGILPIRFSFHYLLTPPL